MLNLEKVRTIYFIGIGGVGMSAAAGVAAQSGFTVFGSDSKAVYDPARSVLDSNDIKYTTGYSEENVANSLADLYIASAGEDMNNPEVAYLREHDIAIHSLSEFLGAIAKDKLRIVVAGTHGKSTTAGLLGTTLKQIDDSSFMTGAILQREETNYHVGEGHYFVFEGDEYKALFDDPTPKFHQYKADILLLTNLEFDHPDIFSSLEEMQDEFRQLLADMPDDGLVVYNADSIALTQLMHENNNGQVSFGIHNQADFVASDITTNKEGVRFKVARNNQAAEEYQINLIGEINVYNALGVIALLRTLGFEQELVQSGFSNYFGVKRRFELIGEKNGVTVYDDYAHHPTAVKETLLAARQQYPSQKIWAVFEPHTFSRTKATLEDLTKAFQPADEVLIAEIYPARENKSRHNITGQDVTAAISKNHQKVRLVANKESALSLLKREIAPGDVVVVMAVGDFNLLAKDLMV